MRIVVAEFHSSRVDEILVAMYQTQMLRLKAFLKQLLLLGACIHLLAEPPSEGCKGYFVPSHFSVGTPHLIDKIVFDFDGTLTRGEDSDARHRWFVEALEAVHPALARSAMEEAEKLLESNQETTGWMDQGRVSAFVEDGFMKTRAIATILQEKAAVKTSGEFTLLAGLKKSGYEDFLDVAEQTFVRTFELDTRLDPSAVEVISQLSANGISIVIVTNSGAEKVLKAFSGSGLDVKDHSESPDAAIRVRGGAKKYRLSTTQQTTLIDGVRYQADRPSYRDILLEESPDMVVGDVVSFDLATPIHLSTRVDRFQGIHTVLLVRDFTPPWVASPLEPELHPGRAHFHRVTSLQQIASGLLSSTSRR